MSEWKHNVTFTIIIHIAPIITVRIKTLQEHITDIDSNRRCTACKKMIDRKYAIIHYIRKKSESKKTEKCSCREIFFE